MSWYLSKIVYRIICGEGLHTPQFDEQLRLIEAENESVAFAKARSFGYREEEMFLNEKQHLVRWEFINVSELYKLTALIDGAELYSKIHESENPDLYITTVHKKATDIQSGSTHKYLQLL
ncbi:MAG TPA: DUF4288 domain-containing protein [Flavitalea sp.]|nr:DUF4288 domain-containing protein [Flavitalea sp.]